MSCYLRHMGWLFRVLEIDKDAGNKHRLDRAMRSALGLAPDVPCREVDAHFEALSAEEKFGLIDTLQRELGS